MIAKRIFDLFFAIAGLICLSPFFILVAAWIRIDSSGSVFFRQERVGRFGHLFRIVKFRTMRQNTGVNGLLLTVGEDDRITRSGAFLRRYKLDEFPQLFNVIAGNMSLVGPRPEVPKYVACYPSDVRSLILSVLPGMTDYASIEFRDENSLLGRSKTPERTYMEEIIPIKLRYYQKYVADRSLWVDLKLILLTCIKMRTALPHNLWGEKKFSESGIIGWVAKLTHNKLLSILPLLLNCVYSVPLPVSCEAGYLSLVYCV